MEPLEKFRLTIKVAQHIERNLEKLAKVLEHEVREGTPEHAAYSNLLIDLRKLYPSTPIEQVANDLITEQCRVQYLKLVASNKPSNWMQDR